MEIFNKAKTFLSNILASIALKRPANNSQVNFQKNSFWKKSMANKPFQNTNGYRNWNKIKRLCLKSYFPGTFAYVFWDLFAQMEFDFGEQQKCSL